MHGKLLIEYVYTRDVSVGCPKCVNAYLALLNHRPLLFSPLGGRFKVNHGVPPSFINFYIVHIDRLLFSAFFCVCEMLVCFVIAFVQFFSH